MNKLDLASIALKIFNSVFASVDGPLVDIKARGEGSKSIGAAIFLYFFLFQFFFELGCTLQSRGRSPNGSGIGSTWFFAASQGDVVPKLEPMLAPHNFEL